MLPLSAARDSSVSNAEPGGAAARCSTEWLALVREGVQAGVVGGMGAHWRRELHCNERGSPLVTRTEKVAVQRSVAATPAAHMPEPCRSPPSFSAAESAVFFLQTGDKHNSSEKVAFHMKATAHFLR